MSIYNLLASVEKAAEWKLEDFILFASEFLDFVQIGQKRQANIQADIVSTSDPNYHFIQYKDDGHYCVTRPYNSTLMMNKQTFSSACETIIPKLNNIREYRENKIIREKLNNILYTCQQSIGCTLDALNNANSAKKRNGIIFEKLIRDFISRCGVNVNHQTETVKLNQTNEFMRFEHDIIISNCKNHKKAIGQIKTSTKDRIDKVFIDSILYKTIKDIDIPYFVIVLNDIQRNKRKDGLYGTNTTFLPGHFKAYTIALHPLDGVYYVDLPNTIKNDKFLEDNIFSFDKLIFEDMWKFLG